MAKRSAALMGSTLAAFVLAGCASLRNPPSSEKDDALYGTSQSNVVSLTEVIEKHPDDPQAYNMRGSVFGEAGHSERALADFNKAINLDPNYAQAYANRALIYRQTGKLDLALADYNKALSLDGSYAPAYLGRGIVHRQQGRGVQALADFNKAIALKPDNAQGYYNRGLLYQSQRQHQFAIDDFSTAIGLTGQKAAPPYVARALSYLAVGDAKSAASDLDEAVQTEPQSLQAWTSRGLAYERLGEKDKAAGSYAKALNINEKYEPAKVGFARVGGKVGQSYQTF
ncbi:MAG TPA: tetratricopeptide repeat protein [Xanthobacteraceae bacterium]|nr:tetratricopeptide repeat protein [Xanthobacteraceae bacterium]